MRLLLYVVRRLLLLIPTLLGVTLITFVLSHAAGPYASAALYCNPHIPVPCTEQLKPIIKAYHLDEPIPVQYFYYLNSLVHGDWGFTRTTLYTGSVSSAVELFFPPTLELAIAATIVATLIGIPMGTISAVKKDRVPDHVTRIIALTGYSIPIFWLGLLLQIAVVKLNLNLDILGQVSPGAFSGRSWVVGQGVFNSTPTHILILDALLHGDWEVFWDALLHLILPTVTLAFGVLGVILRMVRSGMVDTMNQDYVRTAWAKGLPEGVVIKRHIRRNALLPVTTVIGLLFALLLGGVVLVEAVFLWNGIGRWATLAILEYDYAGVMATTLIFAIFLVFVNLFVDILYAYLDPRITL